MKIGFIGAGNMGYAMIKGAQTIFQNAIVYTDVSNERCEYVKAKTGIEYLESNQDVIDHSDIIVLAIKPQYYTSVLMDITISSDKIIISIAPGMTIEFVNAFINGNPKIVRAMPNTPALIGEGMSSVSFGDYVFSDEEKKIIMDLFSSFGKAAELPEKLMDAVVPLSGSSPAYVYMFIEAMADAAVVQGMPRETAYEMAAQSVLGAAKMVLETKEHPGILKDQVCSPGGTTIAAVRSLEENGFRSAVIEAMMTCYDKTLSFKKKED
jgi:pyrroline-5-carboxylate reductase